MAETKAPISQIDSRATIASDPLRRFRFRAEFTPAGGTTPTAFDSRITAFSGGFNTISGLTINVPAIDYREGGFNTTSHKIPGQAVFSDISFGRGTLYGNDGAITWMRGLFAVAAGDGLALSTDATNSPGGGFRCNVKIYLMDHPNSAAVTNVPRMGFYIHNAWITSLSYSGFEAGSNDLMMEGMTLAHEGISFAMLNVAADGSISAAPGSTIPAGF
jgi:phage tail-like protein